MNKIHLACGSDYKPNWCNVDIRQEVKSDKVADILNTDFWDDIDYDSVDYIYSQHFVEHIETWRMQNLIKNCYRALKPGGVLRIATPDLVEVVADCYTGNWKHAAWLKEVPQGTGITTMADYLNVGMREWDHKFLYDEESLRKYTSHIKFSEVNRVHIGESKFQELKLLETRSDSKLIIEFVK